MKCPRCGHEMNKDGHRKYDLNMCYECGYIEGRNYGDNRHRCMTNFEKLRDLNQNEAVAFISSALCVEQGQLRSWMSRPVA